MGLTLESFDRMQSLEFAGANFAHVLANPRVVEALDNLDIHPNDHKRLFDVLDPDRDGFIHIIDLVTGLMRLRGEARRSDIVCVDLMVRSLIKTVHGIENQLAAY